MTAYRGDRQKDSLGIKDRIAVTLIRVFLRVIRLYWTAVLVTKPQVESIWKTVSYYWSVFKLLAKIMRGGWKFEDMYENPGVLTVYFVRDEN